MKNRVKQVLNTILDKFKSGDIPDAIALASYPASDIPSSKWSFSNRILMFLANTNDARGFRQWQQVNRYVKKGSKALYILVPCIKQETDQETGKQIKILKYFKSSPVFRFEDTEGEPLDYQLLELPELPLIDRAEELGISVKAVPGNYRFYGYYSSDKNEIGLASPEEITFFHELAHASHEKVIGKLKKGQDPFQEIVAELSAAALGKLVGKRTNNTMGNSYRYIESYAKKIEMSPYSACLKVLSETEKILNYLLKGEDENEKYTQQRKVG